MSDNKLILYPTNPNWIFEPNYFAKTLQGIGLLGKALFQKESRRDSHFYDVGLNFFKLIKFTASHSVVELELVNGELVETQVIDSRESCYVSLELYPETSFLGSALTMAPLCANCRFQIEDWTEVVSQWYAHKGSVVWTCPQCLTVSTIYALDWNRRNGFAQCSIDIWDVWLDEAKPSESLLSFLKHITAKEWDFLFYRI